MNNADQAKACKSKLDDKLVVRLRFFRLVADKINFPRFKFMRRKSGILVAVQITRKTKHAKQIRKYFKKQRKLFYYFTHIQTETAKIR